MKKILIALAFVLVATIAIAQHPSRMMVHGGPGGPGGPGGCGDVVKFLGLSADQQTQVEALHEQAHASVEPLFAQKETAHDQLLALADAANPDPAAVGRQFLAVRAIDQQIKAVHESTMKKVETLLTPEQKTKFEAFVAAHDCAGGPHMHPM
jgi:Spy/CpxP family protein refolding chaperone